MKKFPQNLKISAQNCIWRQAHNNNIDELIRLVNVIGAKEGYSPQHLRTMFILYREQAQRYSQLIDIYNNIDNQGLLLINKANKDNRTRIKLLEYLIINRIVSFEPINLREGETEFLLWLDRLQVEDQDYIQVLKVIADDLYIKLG